jgi:hypothetical protein
MQQATCILAGFTLITAVALSATTMAADLPKEGTFSGITANTGTYKAYPVGKERVLITWDENSLTVGKGFFDRMTWHCFGLSDIVSGMQQGQGRCIGTDPAGDQIALEADVKPHAADAKTYEATTTFTTGTGKYAGISGGATLVLHGPEFRTATEGTSVQYGEIQAKYKLP